MCDDTKFFFYFNERDWHYRPSILEFDLLAISFFIKLKSIEMFCNLYVVKLSLKHSEHALWSWQNWMIEAGNPILRHQKRCQIDIECLYLVLTLWTIFFSFRNSIQLKEAGGRDIPISPIHWNIIAWQQHPWAIKMLFVWESEIRQKNTNKQLGRAKKNSRIFCVSPSALTGDKKICD